MKTEDINEIISKHTENEGKIISILQDIQARFSYLPEDALRIVAEKTKQPLLDIYNIATFYKSFSLKPRGKHLCSICVGTACHVRGAPVIVKEFQNQLGVDVGETTFDKKFTLETVNCLGACALGPVVVVDGHYFSGVTPLQVQQILDKTVQGLDQVEIKTDKRIFPVEVGCSRCNHSLMDPDFLIDGHPSIYITAIYVHKMSRLRMSSLYGSHHAESKYDIPDGTLLNFFCPHCHTELTGGSKCIECGTMMVPMIVRGGGVIQICPLKGCKGHMLDLV